MQNDSIELKMKLSKSTKGTHVYSAEDAAIKSLYIAKDDLPKNPPLEITVTVSF